MYAWLRLRQRLRALYILALRDRRDDRVLPFLADRQDELGTRSNVHRKHGARDLARERSRGQCTRQWANRRTNNGDIDVRHCHVR